MCFRLFLLGIFFAVSLHPVLAQTTDQFAVTGAIDFRYRNANREAKGTYISAGRLNLDWARQEKQIPKYGGRIQILLEQDKQRGKDINRIRPSELYVLTNFMFAGLELRLKAGQFVLPFGLASVYDTPLQPIQPLYEKSLGLRVDTGIGLDGVYGVYRWSAAMTTGRGPNRFRVPMPDNWLLSFRLSRTVQTQVGRFEIGGSLLSGKGPQTRFDTELPPSGYTGNQAFVSRTRVGGDGQYFLRNLTVRGEFVFGADENNEVWGYFVESNYALSRHLTAVAYSKAWRFPEQPAKATTNGMGLNFDLGHGLTIRTLYEYQANYPQNRSVDPQIIRRLTLQTRLNF